VKKRFLFFLLALAVFLGACNAKVASEAHEADPVKGTVMRYNQLVSEGYRKGDMNLMQEVTNHEQAEKLYFHMAAMGEGKLRLDSTLKDIKFVSIEFPHPDQATVQTRETWDFTQVDIRTEKKFAQEKDFIYQMGYLLKKNNGRWMVDSVSTIEGKSTNTVIPWPKTDRKGGVLPPDHGKQ
jgi:hypothetical protein